MAPDLKDKNSVPIHVGDQVFTPIRGGKHQGEVEDIVRTEQDAKITGTKNPPKVRFTDQHGHNVAHNAGTLRHVND